MSAKKKTAQRIVGDALSGFACRALTGLIQQGRGDLDWRFESLTGVDLFCNPK
jgi:hypothetical protein